MIHLLSADISFNKAEFAVTCQCSVDYHVCKPGHSVIMLTCLLVKLIKRGKTPNIKAEHSRAIINKHVVPKQRVHTP